MRKLFSLMLACLLLFSLSACGREPKEEVSDEKPVIYLYPEQETDVRVTLDLAGELTCAYPAYGDGWNVHAAPDGTLTDEDGNDIELEYVDALELDGQTYMAFFPVVEDDADEEAAEEYGLVILKSVMENGEELLSTLDSDEELDKVYDLFMEQILADEDE